MVRQFRNKTFWVRACGLAALWVAANACAKPVVLSSLKPLTLIVQEIGGELVEPDTLLPANASHHDYPLKMSDYGRLQKADMVVWVGAELESFLQKPISNLPQTKVISAYHLPELHWPAQAYLPVMADKDEQHLRDPHLWLDPRNAAIVGRAIAQRLAQIDPAHQQQYNNNLAAFSAKLQQLDRQISERLKPLSRVGFVVYHEGYGHFVGRYGLHQLDYVVFTPEQKAGAKHWQQMRDKLAKEGKCLFLEPYNEMQSAHDLAKEFHLSLGTLDAMGGAMVTTYEQLLQQMTDAFSACLANGSAQGNL